MMNHQRSEEVALSNAVSGYIERIKQQMNFFNGFYEFVQGDYRQVLEDKKGTRKTDIANSKWLEPYYKGGVNDYLLNSKSNWIYFLNDLLFSK
jgi:hypothetical protein